MTTRYPGLFSPLQLGPMTVPNRFGMAATSHDLWQMDPSGYHRWNMLGERAMYYHAERAKGGFGLITTGQAMVHDSCGTNRPAAHLPEVVDRYRPIADAIHAEGAKVVMQINHNGRGRISGTDDWQPVLTARSDLSFYPGAGGEFTKTVELDEMRSIVKGFGLAAENMERAGFDGVEIHAAHSYLVSEFLTPAYNNRTDQYGGSIQNRMRFLMEIVEEVASRTSVNFAIGVRLNTDWAIPHGFTVEDSIEVARALEATKKIDYLNLTAWSYDRSMSGIGTPFGPVVEKAARVKAALRALPTYVVGRIMSPDQAEQIVRSGQADGVMMARQAIADPELPKKAREGREDEIVQCVGASQGCLGRHFQHMPITCTQNPSVGREQQWGIGTIVKAKKPRKIMVVGAGPAGLETAVVAARRGHEVSIYEATGKLGGQVNLIASSPRRREFAAVVETRQRILDKLGVPIHFNSYVEADMVREQSPDVVVLATGSVPLSVDRLLEGHRLANSSDDTDLSGLRKLEHVYTPHDVLGGAVPTTRRDGKPAHYVLFDRIGFYQSSDPLEYLVARGCRVTAITELGVFASDMIYNDRPSFHKSIRGKPVDIYTFTSIVGPKGSSIWASNNQTGKQIEIDDVDGVVLSIGSRPFDELYVELAGSNTRIERVGDCVTPRRVEHAFFTANEVGRAL